ncbi:MAG: SRPBCC family protein, partial [Actinobacteria bacterium]|nr:SRPBCC family protein [Actinomycetota bacterium]
MQITNRFTVPAPVDQAWDALLDVRRVAPCFPGATVERVDGDEFAGRVKVKLGPIQLTYAGTGRFVERDAANRRAVIEGAARDTNGSSTATALVTTSLAEHADGTEVTVLTDFAVTGKPAQFGRGVMQDVSARMVSQFAANLSRSLTAEPEAVVPAGPIDEPAQLDLVDVAGAAIA